MSWPQWPMGQSGVIPGMVNSAPPVMAAGATMASQPPLPGTQYTPEQWAQMQHQNWQQWAQWQQQYQQWHQQYGAEYQKSLSALNPQGVQPPLPGAAVPSAVLPPLPNTESKPPLPPDDPPPQPTQSQPNFPSAQSDSFNTGYKTDQSFPLQNFDASKVPPNWPGSFQNQHPYQQLPNQPPFSNQHLPNQTKFPNQSQFPNQLPNQQQASNQQSSIQPSNQSYSTSQYPQNQYSTQFNQMNAPPPNKRPSTSEPVDSKKTKTENQPPIETEELSEPEKKFMKQFADWESQFNKWKEQNANHPDKEQYREYEKKWETWRAQLLERREQMRRKRLSMTSTQSKAGLLPTPEANKLQISSNSDSNQTGFLQTSSSGGIPGLDLVKEGSATTEDKENPPDFDAISKGINSILGDKKLLSMLSQVSQQSGLLNFNSEVKTLEETRVNSNESNEMANYHTPTQIRGDIADEQTRSSFGGNFDDKFNRPPPGMNKFGVSGPQSFGGNAFGGSQNLGVMPGQNKNIPSLMDSPIHFGGAQNLGPSQNLGSSKNFSSPQNLGMSHNPGQSHPLQNVGSSNKFGPVQNTNSSQNLVPPQNMGPSHNFNSSQNLGASHNFGPSQNFGPGHNMGRQGNISKPFQNIGESKFGFNRDSLGKPFDPPEGFSSEINRGRYTVPSKNFDQEYNEDDELNNDPFAEDSNDARLNKFSDNKEKYGANFGSFNERGGNQFGKSIDGMNRNLDGFNQMNQGPGRMNPGRGGMNFGPGGLNQGPGEFNRESNRFNQRPNFNRYSDDYRKDRGMDDFNRGRDEFNRGQDHFNRGKDEFNRGQDFNLRSDELNRKPDRFSLGGLNKPGGFNQGPGGVKDGPGGFVDGPGVFKDGPGGFKDGPGGPIGFKEGPDGFNQGLNRFNQGPGGFNRGPPPILGPGGPIHGPGGPIHGPGGLPHGPGGPIHGPGGLPHGPGGPIHGPGGPNQGPPGFNQGFGPDGLEPNKKSGTDLIKVGQNIEDEEGMWKPANIIDYDHVSIKQYDFDVFVEPLLRFDYRHKPVNRIPLPDRPKWLTDVLKTVHEFVPLIGMFPIERFARESLDYPGKRFATNKYPDDRIRPFKRGEEDDRFRRDDNRFDRKEDDKERSDKFSRDGDRFSRRDDDKFGRRDDDKFGRRDDDRFGRKDDDRFGRRGDDRFGRRDDDRFARKDDRSGRKDDDRFGRKDDDRFGRKDEDRSGRKDDDKFGRKDEDDKFRNRDSKFDRRDDRFNRDDQFGRRDDQFRRRDDQSGRRSDQFNRRDEFSRKEDLRRDDSTGKHNDEYRNKDFPMSNNWQSGDSLDEMSDDKQGEKRERLNDSDDNLDAKRWCGQKPLFDNQDLTNVGDMSGQNASMFNKAVSKSNVTIIDDLLNPPGRFNRPARIVIILRGPPGSGKTFLAKLIKDKEVENGGSPPRILSLDDYFMVEQEKEIVEDGKRVRIKDMVYEYEEAMEASYRMSLFKSFKKTITDGYFPFIIVDNVNDKVKNFGEMWSFAKQNGFQVYVCQMELDLQTCVKRNIHGRSQMEIEKCIQGWEPTPNHHPTLDCTSLLQADAITEVEMEEIDSNASDEAVDGVSTFEGSSVRSKWDAFDCSIDNLAKLDGTSKPLRPSKTMEDYLQLDNEWTPTHSNKPGQKRVRWADLEERKQQEKMRAIGFVVGQTNWDRMMDPTMGSSALTQTKYIERVRKY